MSVRRLPQQASREYDWPFLTAGRLAHHRIQTREHLISAPRSEPKSGDTAADALRISILEPMKRDTQAIDLVLSHELHETTHADPLFGSMINPKRSERTG